MRKLKLMALIVSLAAIAYWVIERQRYSVYPSKDEYIIQKGEGYGEGSRDSDLVKLPTNPDSSETLSEDQVSAESVNPTIDRFGIPSSRVVALTPAQLDAAQQARQQKLQREQASVDSGLLIGAAAGVGTSIDRELQSTEGGPVESQQVSSAPEVLDSGGMGLAPENEGVQLPALPPQATDLGEYDLGPESTDSGATGSSPESTQEPPQD
jgi:hypothetical protein